MLLDCLLGHSRVLYIRIVVSGRHNNHDGLNKGCGKLRVSGQGEGEMEGPCYRGGAADAKGSVINMATSNKQSLLCCFSVYRSPVVCLVTAPAWPFTKRVICGELSRR